jgi:hypothetical protein
MTKEQIEEAYYKWNNTHNEDGSGHNSNKKRSEVFATGYALAEERLKVAEKALDEIDWHIRGMHNEGVITMKEMVRALKVISDSLHTIDKVRQTKVLDGLGGSGVMEIVEEYK